MTEEDWLIRASCTHFLSNHGLSDPSEVLLELSRHSAANSGTDFYGSWGAVSKLEARISELFEKQSAQFFIKGVTAQLAVLRTVSEQRPGPIIVPSLSHIIVDEADAISHVAGLNVVRVEQISVSELERVGDVLSACVVELPLRRAAYQLLPIVELRAISQWCRSNSVHLHFDGARIWEAAAGYGIELAELAALADSIYVSFYKGLGGLAGAAVIGERSLLQQMKVWKTRLGGDLHTAYPYAIAAIDGLDRRLPKMRSYVSRARQLASAMRHKGLEVYPSTPHVNGFQIILPGSPAALKARHQRFAREQGVWLFNRFFECSAANQSAAEVVIGDAADANHDDAIVEWVLAFIGADSAI